MKKFILLMDDQYYDRGFSECEIKRKVVDEYNGIANVFQSFYAKDSENHEEKGINSYQLVYAKKRWWIRNILWMGDLMEVSTGKIFTQLKKWRFAGHCRSLVLLFY